MIDIWIHWIQLIIDIQENVECNISLKTNRQLFDPATSIDTILGFLYEKLYIFVFFQNVIPHSLLFFCFQDQIELV